MEIQRKNKLPKWVKFLLLVIGAGVIYGTTQYFFSSQEAETPDSAYDKAEGTGSEVRAVSAIDRNTVVMPAVNNNPEFVELQKQENKERLEQAQEQIDTFVPVLTKEVVKEDNPILEEIKEEPPKEEEKVEVVNEEPVVEEPVLQEEPQEETFEVSTEQPTMEMEEEKLNIEEPKPIVTYKADVQEFNEEDYYQQVFEQHSKKLNHLEQIFEEKRKNLSPNKQSALPITVTYYDTLQRQQEEEAKKAEEEQKAKTSLFGENPKEMLVNSASMEIGVLISSINTDEPSPVVAKIISANKELNGARLLGVVDQAPKDITDNVLKARILFNRLVLKDKREYEIEAYAMDEKSGRVALASRADRHIFENYVLGGAASFLEGLGNAIASGGSETVIHENGTSVTTRAKNSAKEEARIALGNVGVNLGRSIAKRSDRPATIYVDAGTRFNVLFMKSVVR